MTCYRHNVVRQLNRVKEFQNNILSVKTINSFDFRSLCFVWLSVWVVNALVHVNTLLPFVICDFQIQTSGSTWFVGSKHIQMVLHAVFDIMCNVVPHLWKLTFTIWSAMHFTALQYSIVTSILYTLLIVLIFFSWRSEIQQLWYYVLCTVVEANSVIFFMNLFRLFSDFWPTPDFSYTPTLNNKA